MLRKFHSGLILITELFPIDLMRYVLISLSSLVFLEHIVHRFFLLGYRSPDQSLATVALQT